MAQAPPRHLKPRKRPLQARAAVTLDAIFEATVQVLLAEGPQLTTTRVAKRAGVSVGTMYQYFPHKQSLLYALNERYLDDLAATLEAACKVQHGRPIAEMVKALVSAYWQVKMARIDVTRALYRSVVELDNEALIEAFARRVDVATIAMLDSAPDARFSNLTVVNATLLTVIFGTVRSVFERGLPPALAGDVQKQLVKMCVGYLEAARRPPAKPRAAA